MWRGIRDLKVQLMQFVLNFKQRPRPDSISNGCLFSLACTIVCRYIHGIKEEEEEEDKEEGGREREEARSSEEWNEMELEETLLYVLRTIMANIILWNFGSHNVTRA